MFLVLRLMNCTICSIKKKDLLKKEKDTLEKFNKMKNFVIDEIKPKVDGGSNNFF